jgi:hypothetical protein
MHIEKAKDIDSQTGKGERLRLRFRPHRRVRHALQSREKSFGLRTPMGDQANLTPEFARISQNLEEAYQDCTGRIGEMLEVGQYVFAYGVFYPTTGGTRFEVKSLVFPGEKPGHYRHEEPDWWINQVRSIADCYLRWEFGYLDKPIDFRE